MKVVFVCGSSHHEDVFIPVVDALRSIRPAINIEFLLLEGMTCSLFTSFESMWDLKESQINVASIAEFNNDFVSYLLQKKPQIIVLPNDTSLPYLTLSIASNFLEIPSLFYQTAAISRSPFNHINNISKSIFWALKSSNGVLVVKLYLALWNTLVRCRMPLTKRINFLAVDMINRLHLMFMEGHGYCDKIAVMNPHTKDMFLKDGINPNKIEVVGFTKFEKFLNRDFRDKEEIMKKYHLDPNRPIVSLMTNCKVEHKLWTQSQRKQFIRNIISDLLDTDLQLIVKVHPNEDESDYVIEAAKTNFHCKIIKNADIYEILSISDIVLPEQSTTWLEAAAMKKSIIMIDYFNELSDSFPPVRIGWPRIIKSGVLSYTIGKLLSEEELCNNLIKRGEKEFFDYLYLLDGKSSERVARLIISMTNISNC